MSLVNLDSVGCVIDKSGVTYPMLVDGGFDEDGFELYLLADTKDREVIEEYLETTK